MDYQELVALWERERQALDDALLAGQAASQDWAVLPFGVALRLLRKRLRLKQWELARLIGARQPAVSKIERGADLRLSTLCRLYAALGCDVVILPRPRRPTDETARRIRDEFVRARAEGWLKLQELLTEARRREAGGSNAS